jgi:hypothetical protein
MNAAFAERLGQTFFTSSGEFVDISKKALPSRIPVMRPSAPSATASIAATFGRQVKTTSHC